MFGLVELDAMIEGICMVLDDGHLYKCEDGHWLTSEEVIAMPEAQVIDLFHQIYGRD